MTVQRQIVGVVCGLAIGAGFGLKAHDRVSDWLHPPGPSAQYLNRMDFLSRFPPHGAIAFVGDSQIERADWNALLGRNDVANYGISGDDTAGLANRLDAVERSGAGTAVVLVGVNDLFAGHSAAETAGNIAQIVATLSKTMRVILVSVLPTAKEHQRLSREIVELDNLLQAGCANPCSYVDLVPALGGASLADAFTRDGLHLTSIGYAAVAEPLKRALQASPAKHQMTVTPSGA